MILHPELAETVRKRWIEDQNHPLRGRRELAIPEQSEFEALLDVLFKASLMSEEGRETLASVCWISPDQFTDLQIPKRRETPLLIKFSAPLPLEPKVISKLNRVTNGKTSTFLAGIIDQAPKIWGICYFNKFLSTLEEVPYGLMETRHFSPDCLTITITKIGSLLISREYSVIGRIEAGEFYTAEPTPFTYKGLAPFLYNLINVEIDGKTFATKEDGNTASIFIAAIKYLLAVIAEKRIGATIILVPDDHKETIWDFASTAWNISGDIELQNLMDIRQKFLDEQNESVSAFHEKAGFTIKSNEILRQRLDNLASLAEVDGALIVTSTFIPVGFGVKLNAEKWVGSFRHGNTIYSNPTETSLDFSRLGTRHNSAANFVGVIPGAIAFVASSDGPIRAIVRSDKDCVEYWPDCRVSMFAE